MVIGPLRSYQDVYVAACGKQFTDGGLGRRHEKECQSCQGETGAEAALESLPELSQAEHAAMSAMPDDLPERLNKGEWWDGARYWTARDAVCRIRDLLESLQVAWLDGYRNGETASTIGAALRRYAGLAPLDLKEPREIQSDLLSIAGDKHRHQASIANNDSCFICGRDLRDEVHIPGAAEAAGEEKP